MTKVDLQLHTINMSTIRKTFHELGGVPFAWAACEHTFDRHIASSDGLCGVKQLLISVCQLQA